MPKLTSKLKWRLNAYVAVVLQNFVVTNGPDFEQSKQNNLNNKKVLSNFECVKEKRDDHWWHKKIGQRERPDLSNLNLLLR